MVDRTTPSRASRLTVIAVTLAVMAGALISAASDGRADDASRETDIEIGLAIFGEIERVCYCDDFLKRTRRDTTIRVSPKLHERTLSAESLRDHPYLIITGDRRFSWNHSQREALRDYWRGGGFVLASAACGTRSWAESFRREVRAIHPDAGFRKLPEDHPIYDLIYDLRAQRSTERETGDTALPPLEALYLDGRLAALLCTRGLNDTDKAGEDCCCCGGREYAFAEQLNVNILAYALTH